MLKQSHRLLVHELRNHITQHRANGIESLVRLADVLQPHVIEQDLLYDEDGDCLAQLRPGLHDTETEGDDFGGEQEVDDFGAVVLDESADHTEGGQAEVFEGPRFRGRVEEGVEEEGDMCWFVSAICTSLRLGCLCLWSLPPRKSPRVS